MRWVLGIIMVFAAALLQFIGGHILAPEYGLMVPSYWAWFWFDLIVVIPACGLITLFTVLFGD